MIYYVYNIQKNIELCLIRITLRSRSMFVFNYSLWGDWQLGPIPMDSGGFQHDAGDRKGHFGRIRPGTRGLTRMG